MPSKPTLETLAKQEQSLRDKITRLEKELRALKDVLNIHDNWNAEIREWIGKQVKVRTSVDGFVGGKLLWSDRYNICLEIATSSAMLHKRIVNKGHIVWIELT